MRHGKGPAKLGMKSQHRRAVLANLVCSLIKHNRITTTITKAKVARRFADKMITLAKGGTLHHRRQALAFLRHADIVHKLFTDLGKQHGDRQGGYTRILRIGQRPGDASHMAILEWTGTVVSAPAPDTGKKAEETKPAAEATEAKPAAKKAKAKKSATKETSTAK